MKRKIACKMPAHITNEIVYNIWWKHTYLLFNSTEKIHSNTQICQAAPSSACVMVSMIMLTSTPSINNILLGYSYLSIYITFLKIFNSKHEKKKIFICKICSKNQYLIIEIFLRLEKNLLIKTERKWWSL